MPKYLALLLLVFAPLATAWAQPLELDPDELAWLAEAAIPLETTDPAASLDDLAFLDEFVGDARIVALGEATHGNREVAEVRYRFIRYLVEEMGFTHVVFEAPVAYVARVDRYVVAGEGDAEQALEHLLYWPWRIQSVRDLLAWARAFNASGRGPVRFAGMDVQAPDESIRVVLAFLGRVDPGYLHEARAAYGFVDALEAGEDVVGSWRVGATEVLDHLTAHREAYLERASEGEVAWALQNARVVLQGAQARYDTLPSRDESMARNVAWLLERNPEARLILWAHDGHVTEYDARPGVGRRLGSFLAERYGDDYRSVGVALHRGAFHATAQGTHELVTVPLASVPDGTLGQQLARVGLPLFFLPLEGTADVPEAAWLGERQVTHSVGASAQRTTLRPVVPRRAFDGLVFFDRVTPSRLMDPDRADGG